jgi:hypothetical protein
MTAREWQRINRLADRFVPAVRNAFRTAMDQMAESTRRVLSRADLSRAYAILSPVFRKHGLRLQDVSTTVLREVVREAWTISRSGAREDVRAGNVDDSAMDLSFSTVNPLAVRYAEQRTGQLVSDITSVQRRAINAAIASGIAGQLEREEVVDRIASIVGLTERDAMAVNRYVDATATKLMDDGMSESKARRLAAKLGREYRDRLVAHRADVIARNETQQAAIAGQELMWKQMADAGLFTTKPKRLWIVTPDETLCGRCRAFRNRTARVGEPFVGRTGERADGPPLHVMCRCGIGLTFADDPAPRFKEPPAYNPRERTLKPAINAG